VKYAWIEKHRQSYSTTLMCELLLVSRSGLNAARKRGPSKRSLQDKQLVEQMSKRKATVVVKHVIGTQAITARII
jgi:putative transposase